MCDARLLFRSACVLAFFAVWAKGVNGQSAQDGGFVEVRDGHLFRNGQRLRLWGINVQGPNRVGVSSCAKVDSNVQRIRAMGFNAVRLWGGNVLCEAKDGRRVTHDYRKGDGSPLDLMDYCISKLKEEGFVIWLTWFDYRNVVPEDADLVNDPATRIPWEEAVRELQKPEYATGRGLVFYFDPRARAAYREQITRVLSHVNQWTGTAIRDEPAIGIYELDNERQFMDNMLGVKGKAGYGHASVENVLPKFFADELRGQWVAFLEEKYKTQEALRGAWGALDDGEDLARGDIRLQPTYATASKYPSVRGEDILAFYRKLFVGTCEGLVQHVRKCGAPSRGCAVVPIIFHTIASVNGLHIAYSNSSGDAVAYGDYWMQYADEDRAKKRPPVHPPWYSFAEGGPGWGFIHPPRQADKPCLVYETNCNRTDKFRAEFPLLHAIGGCWADLDGICFYQWDYHFGRDATQLAADRLYYPTTDHGPHGYTTYSDEISLAQMLTARRIFVRGMLPAPSEPTVVRYGRSDLGSVRQQWYGVLHRIFPTVLRYGVRIAFDPGAEETKIEGPSVEEKQWDGKRWVVGESLVWSAEQGFVTLDLPQAKAAAGFLSPELSFGDGVRIRGVKKLWTDPDDIAASKGGKVGEYRPYYGFTMVSDDGLPLTQAKRVLVSLVSTSQNTGFAFDPSKAPRTGPDGQAMARGIVSPGTMPVQVNRVGATISALFLQGKAYRKLDFAMKVFEEGLVKDNLVVAPTDPLFIAVIEAK